MKKKSLRTKRKQAAKVRSRPSKAKKEKPLQFRIYLKRKQKQTSAAADLPFSYNVTKLALLVRDPYWAYAYWDFSRKTWDWIQEFRRKDKKAACVLRIYNLDNQSFYDLPVHFEAQNWYLDFGKPGTNFETELGIIDSSGKFHGIVKSNRVKTPRNGPSPMIDPRWPAKDFEELYKLSGGGKTGKGSEVSSRFIRI